MLSHLFRRSLPAMVAVTFAAGCAAVPVDRGASEVSALTQSRGGPALQVAGESGEMGKAELSAMLSRELSAADSLRVAFLNSPRVKAELSRLGIASADVAQAGRLSNPTLSASVLRPNVAGEANQVTFGLAQSFTDLLFMSSRTRFARGEHERAKAEAGAAVLKLARDVEEAYYTLVGAQQVAVMRSTVATAARASADLAQRYVDAGNITDLALSLEKSAAAQAELDAISASAKAVEARSELNVLMGLPADETRWTVGKPLSLPVPTEDDPAALQKMASEQQLELIAARQEVLVLKDAAGVTRRLRYLGKAEVGIETERETDRSRITGPTLSLELPIFNQNQGGVLRANAQLELAEARLRQTEVEISNGVALAAAKVDAARRSVELLRTQLVPMRERVVLRTQEQVNYMLVGVFDLIRAKQEEYDAYETYLLAVRDYWLSRTELALAVGSDLPSNSAMGAASVAPIEPVEPPTSGGHMGHNMGAMKGMNHSGHSMEPAKTPQADPHAGHDMKDMQSPGTDDMGGMDMEGMDHSSHRQNSPKEEDSDPHSGHTMDDMGDMDMGDMKGMDMSGMKGMERKPAAKPSADKTCLQLKGANPNDPLTRALKKKCQETPPKTGKTAEKNKHSSTDSDSPPADDHSSHGDSHH